MQNPRIWRVSCKGLEHFGIHRAFWNQCSVDAKGLCIALEANAQSGTIAGPTETAVIELFFLSTCD